MKQKQTDSLGDRMKAYEAITRTFLIPKLHTIIRLDGKAFHTYTKKFKKPFDDDLINAMDEAAKYLCGTIQGAKFAFVQSDEISIYLSDRDTLETQMWYDGNVQKMVSVSASKATAKFNHLMFIKTLESITKIKEDTLSPYYNRIDLEDILKPMPLAEFDSRVFQLPNEEEVVNCMLWRQQDTIRNSISSVAQSNFSHGGKNSELHGVNTGMMIEKLAKEKGIDFYKDFSLKLQQGRFIQKNTYVNGKMIYPVAVGGYYKPESYSHESFIKRIEDSDKVRSKWESVECPKFNEQREFILYKLQPND